MRHNLAKRLLIVVLCLSMLASFSACKKAAETPAPAAGTGTTTTPATGTPSTPAASKKDTITVVLMDDIEYLSPSEGQSSPHVQAMRQVFETLTYRDKDMKLQPLLAKSWEWKNDTTLVFHLDENAKFNDGSDLKASDVLFTAKYSIDKKTVAYPNFAPIDIAKSSAPDEHTVQFVLTAPQPNLVELLENALCGIMSEAAFNKFGGKYSTPESCVGTGPYVIKEYKVGDSLTMEANPNYWNKALAPKIKNLKFRFVTDSSSRSIEAETGKADIVYNIASADVDRIKSNKKINYMGASGTNTNYICINSAHKPLDNPKVREAIWYAVDREASVKSAYKSFGSVATGIFSPDLGGRHPDLSKYFVKQDIAKAKALLAEAGFPNGQGIPKLTIHSNLEQSRVDLTEAIQSQLAAIGIQLECKNLPGAASGQAIMKGEADFAVYGFSATTFEVGRNVVRWLPTDVCFPIFGWKSDEYVKTVTDAMKTTDQDARYKLFYKAQELLMDAKIALPMWTLEINAALQPDVKGFYIMRSYEQHLIQFCYFE